MRNLKRALSLALATVMTLGLMVVGTGAVGYTDVTSEDNQEAIEVLQAVGIMTGVTEDEFNPDGLVTRNQIAVIMANLLNLDYDYYRGINPFTDVPSWAAPYVAACAAEGVVAGIGGGLYGGENNVTAAQAALMIMKALGYFQYQGDFNPDWQVATIRQGSYINLFDGVDANAEQALTRGQVAQMVLNGLEATMVEFTGDVGTQITVGETTIDSGYRAEYSERTSAESKYGTLVSDRTNVNGAYRYIIQLGEELYEGDLRKDGDEDSLGRPATTWVYDGDDIGTYVTESPVATYVAETDRNDVRRDLRSYDYDTGLRATVNGEADGPVIDSYSDVAALTADGTIVEVYVTDGEIDVVVVVETDDAEVTSVNDRRETFTISYNGTTEVIDDDSDFYGLYGQVEEDDILVVTYNSSNDVLDLYIPETVTGEITYVNRNENEATVNDETVTAADTAGALFAGTLGEDSVIYLNAAGYAVYVDAASSSDADYAFVTDMWREDGTGINQGSQTIYAQVVYTDGTMETIEVANTKDSGSYNASELTALGFSDLAGKLSNDTGILNVGGDQGKAYRGPGAGTVTQVNRVLQYTESTEDAGVYMLTVPATGSSSVEGVTAYASDAVSSNASRISDVYMSSDVTFVYVDGNGDDARASVGEKAAINAGTQYQAVVEEDGNRNLATVVFIQGGSAASDDVIYISSVGGSVRYTDADGDRRTGTRVEYYAYGETEPSTMIVNERGGDAADVGFFTISGTDGDANELDEYTMSPADRKVVDNGASDMYNGWITIGSQEYNLNDAMIVDVTDSGLDSISALENAIEDGDQTVYVSLTADSDYDVEIAYVQDVKSSDTGIRSVIMSNEDTGEEYIADINDATHTITVTAPAITGRYIVTVDPTDRDSTVAIYVGSDPQDTPVSGRTDANVPAGTYPCYIDITADDGTYQRYTINITLQ